MQNNLLLRNPTSSKLYVEDVFSTYLYTGTSAPQTITNGIDTAGKGGLVWLKSRAGTVPSGYDKHVLFDTARTNSVALATNSTAANETGWGNLFFRFRSDGFDTGTSTSSGDQSYINSSGASYASWTFRKSAKFFDCVTWTGNGSVRTISHNLGVTPGMIIIKRTDSVASWVVYHRSITAANYLYLDRTDASNVFASFFNNTEPTSSVFTVGTGGNVNTNGATYVAYLFAHDTTTDGIVQCGSFTTDAIGSATVSLGWEPQFLLFKRTDATGNWFMLDNMRGYSMTQGNIVYSNLTNAEAATLSGYANPTSTGFQFSNSYFGASNTFVYLAIRRGPMRVPTDATKVFSVSTRTGASGASTLIPSGGLSFSPDLLISTPQANSNSFNYRYFINRLADQFSLQSESTGAEQFGTSNPLATFAGYQNQVWVGPAGVINQQDAMIDFFLRRAPSFFDVICYTGTGSARTVSHNLGVAPELMIVKGRNLVSSAWRVYASSLGATKFLNLHTTGAATTQSDVWNDTSPTSSVFTVGTDNSVNSSGNTIVAYLFASCSGVSKVGSYTGNGSSLNIDCGFTNGARFVLIKRTDSTGNWFVWNSARGIVAANDPYISLNTTNAEITTNDSLDPLSAGFTVNQLTATNINVNAATYIYLAIA